MIKSLKGTKTAEHEFLLVLGLFAASIMVAFVGISGIIATPSSKVFNLELGDPAGVKFNSADSDDINPVPNSRHENGKTGCMFALNKSVADSLIVTKKSSLVTDGCTVHSNAFTDGTPGNPANSNRSNQHAVSSLDETPQFASLQPSTKECDHQNLSLKEGAHVLKPGVYCGGIISLTATKIELLPGIYVMKDGPLYLAGTTVLHGQNVGLHFVGNRAVLGTGPSTTLSLTAPKSGPMTGILIYEDPEVSSSRDFTIRSHDAGLLEGMIYLPKGRLVVDGSKLGRLSKWTTIVADRIEIMGGSSVETNSDYAASDIPLPDEQVAASDVAFLSN